jgi:hypothetical protein
LVGWRFNRQSRAGPGLVDWCVHARKLLVAAAQMGHPSFDMTKINMFAALSPDGDCVHPTTPFPSFFFFITADTTTCYFWQHIGMHFSKPLRY